MKHEPSHLDAAPVTLHLRNDQLAVAILPLEGGRIASLRSLNTGVEFLTQSQGSGQISQAGMDARFQDGPCAGIEECLPTVGMSNSKTHGGAAPDHGDFWQLKWEVDEADEKRARLHAQGFSRTLLFTKDISLQDDLLRVHYEVKNTGSLPQSFLYACHPLFAIDPGDRVFLPAEVRSVTLDYSRNNRLGDRGDSVTWPHSHAEDDLDLVKPQDAGIAEMLYTCRLREGRCAVYRAAHHQFLEITFNTSVLPFLGIWLCYGGWPGGTGSQQYAVALEPTTSPHNSLLVAQDSRSDISLEAGSIASWDISFRVAETF